MNQRLKNEQLDKTEREAGKERERERETNTRAERETGIQTTAQVHGEPGKQPNIFTNIRNGKEVRMDDSSTC